MRTTIPAEHGTRARYRRGCRCDDCKRVNSEYMTAWRARHVEPVNRTLADPYEAWPHKTWKPSAGVTA